VEYYLLETSAIIFPAILRLISDLQEVSLALLIVFDGIFFFAPSN
jgi:hypothetical protein